MQRNASRKGEARHKSRQNLRNAREIDPIDANRRSNGVSIEKAILVKGVRREGNS
jgi:hypothetical protein